MYEALIKELDKEGYDAEFVEVDKVGGKRPGIKVHVDDRINPVVYPDALRSRTVKGMIMEILEILKNSKKDIKKIDVDNFFKDILDTVFFQVCEKAPANSISIKFLDLHAFLRYPAPGIDDAYVTITKENIAGTGYTEKELKAAALVNTIKSGRVSTFSEMLGLPLPYEMWIVDSAKSSFGANQLMNHALFKKICKDNDLKKLVITPFGDSELAVVDAEEFEDTDFTSIIEIMNDDFSEVITDHPYYYDIETDKVTF